MMQHGSLARNPDCLRGKGNEMGDGVVLEGNWNVGEVIVACSKGMVNVF